MTAETSAVRFFVPDNPQLLVTAKSQLHKEAQAQSDQIGAGYATDWANYRERVGFIRGLTKAIQIIEELEKDQQERK